MAIKFRVWRRLAYTIMAAALMITVAYPIFNKGEVSADQLASRSITLSDSGASGGSITSGVGSGTDVTYQVGFTTSATAESLVIDFCSNDPIINDTCDAPTGMDASSAVLAGVTGGGNITSPGWGVTASASQVKLAMGSGSAIGVGAQQFDLTDITNPSAVGSFYARIYTYANSTWGTYQTAAYDSANPTTTGVGDYIDYGGIALSTVQVITITARVQETLTFCISGDPQAPADLPGDPSYPGWSTDHDCSDPNANVAPALILGHGSPTAILDSSAVDTGTVYSQLSTNATTGAVINMRNSNTSCGGLSADGDSTCAIPAVGATAAPITQGVAAFGMYAAPSADESAGVGSLTIASAYSGGGQTDPPDYGMDNTSTDNVETEYGSQVASSGGPCYEVDENYTFAATAALTTPAGIYTANIDMIATGTF